MKNKLIQYPEVIDDILQEYKEKTGVNVNAYIQGAIIRQLIHDNLISLVKVDVYIDKKTGKIIEISK